MEPEAISGFFSSETKIENFVPALMGQTHSTVTDHDPESIVTSVNSQNEDFFL